MIVHVLMYNYDCTYINIAQYKRCAKCLQVKLIQLKV